MSFPAAARISITIRRSVSLMFTKLMPNRFNNKTAMDLYTTKKTYYRLPLVCSYLVPGFSYFFVVKQIGSSWWTSRKKQANAAEERAAAAAEWKLKGFLGAKFSRSSLGKNVSPRRNTPLKFNMLHLKISPWKMSCLFWKPSFSPKCIWTLPLKSVGWKTSLSYWVLGTCQGLTVKLRGVYSIKSTWNTKKWRFGRWFFFVNGWFFWSHVNFHSCSLSLNLRNCGLDYTLISIESMKLPQGIHDNRWQGGSACLIIFGWSSY